MTRRLIARIGLGIAFTTVLATAAIVPASAAPAAHTAVLKGQVFADANSNARADHGEGLRGAKLKLENFDTNTDYKITTGADGRFRAVLPTGTYYVGGGKTRWKVIAKIFHLHADGRALALRAVRPLGKHVLSAQLDFTKDRYAVGDRVHITVTLTNSGSKVLRGIGAQCDHIGDPNELYTTRAGWGKLVAYGPGVSIKAHKTRTFDVTNKVPAAARRSGEVVIECDFGYADVVAGHRPDAYDAAKVPGEFGRIHGAVGHDRHGKLVGLANVRLVLVDPDYCPLYTRRTSTDRHGNFRIRHIPAGTYHLYVYPTAGWKLTYNPASAWVFGNDTSDLSIGLVRGHKHVPAPPTTCS